jgi:hypothetical protein
MKKLFLILILPFLLVMSGCSNVAPAVEAPSESANSVYEDVQYGVSFEYPAHWDIRVFDHSVMFAANFDYADGLSESSTSTELEGSLHYRIQENPDGESLHAYYNSRYRDCLAQPMEDEVFGNLCPNPVLNFSTQFEIGEYAGHMTDWEGIPESGEQAKELYVDVRDKNVFVVVSAVRTGVTDPLLLEKILLNAFETLEIE